MRCSGRLTAYGVLTVSLHVLACYHPQTYGPVVGSLYVQTINDLARFSFFLSVVLVPGLML